VNLVKLKITAIAVVSAFVCLSSCILSAAPADIEKEFKGSEAFPFYEKGNDYLKNGQCDQAIAEYVKAAQSAPDYYGIYNKLGYALYYSGRFEEALNYFRRALILNRENVDTVLGIANVYMVLEQEPEARHYFEKAMEMDPGNISPCMPLALIYNRRNMFAESKSLVKKALVKYPRLDSAYFLLGQDQESLNEIDPAIESYKKVIELTPGYAKAYLRLARCYMVKNRYNMAYDYAKQALKHRLGTKETYDTIFSLKKILKEDKTKRALVKAKVKNN
jgi:tetratricopeptide (TPR) repeat protein